jgi:hypothetical protein
LFADFSASVINFFSFFFLKKNFPLAAGKLFSEFLPQKNNEKEKKLPEMKKVFALLKKSIFIFHQCDYAFFPESFKRE